MPAAKDLNARLDAAARLGEQGRSEQAEAICREVLAGGADLPQRARALHLLGLAQLQSGRGQAALQSLQQSFELLPLPAVAGHLGVSCCQLGDLRAGAAWLERALSQAPDDPLLLGNLLLARQKLADWPAVLRLCRRLLGLHPQDPGLNLSLARALARLGQPAEASESFKASLALQPAQPRVWFELGQALRALGDDPGALAAYRRALALDPDQAEAQTNLGVILLEQGALAEAMTCYQAADRLQPGHPVILLNLAGLQATCGQTEAARRNFEHVLRLDPGNPQALDGLLRVRLDACDWHGLEALLGPYLDLIETADGERLSPFNSLFLPLSPAQQLALARAQARRIEAKAAAIAQPVAGPGLPASDSGLPAAPAEPEPASRRLRIGYLSADFRAHILGDMIRELFSRHDLSRFELFAYAFNPDEGSPVYADFRRQAEHFRDLSGLSLSAAEAALRQDKLDLLVYLGGYTDGDRAELLARRPAPVQLAYLDYPATLGAGWIDWLLCDARVCPPELADAYSERLCYLPGTYQLNAYASLPTVPPPSRAEVGLPAGAFVFSCFCKPNRLSSKRFGLWLRLLAQQADSVLWLLQQNPAAAANLRQLARDAGIDPERLIFAPNLPRPQHLARQTLADLFLDTEHCNAHTTAADALWAGVPVISLPGRTFTSRVGLSLLEAVGLPELAVADEAAYEALALALARAPERLAGLKAYLLNQGRNSALFDTARTIKGLEAAYNLIHNLGREPGPPIVLAPNDTHATKQQG